MSILTRYERKLKHIRILVRKKENSAGTHGCGDLRLDRGLNGRKQRILTYGLGRCIHVAFDRFSHRKKRLETYSWG